MRASKAIQGGVAWDSTDNVRGVPFGGQQH